MQVLAMSCVIAVAAGCGGSTQDSTHTTAGSDVPATSAQAKPDATASLSVKAWASGAEDQLVDLAVARETLRRELAHPQYDYFTADYLLERESQELGSKASALVDAVDTFVPVAADCPDSHLKRALDVALASTRDAANFTRIAAASLEPEQLQEAVDELNAAAHDFIKVKRRLPAGT
jgi:hypothetical protein